MTNKTEIIVKHITEKANDQPDSIEVGTPAKGGAVKVYGDAGKPEEFKQKLKNMLELRAWADGQAQTKEAAR